MHTRSTKGVRGGCEFENAKNSFSTSKYLFRWKLKREEKNQLFFSPQAENSQLGGE